MVLGERIRRKTGLRVAQRRNGERTRVRACVCAYEPSRCSRTIAVTSFLVGRCPTSCTNHSDVRTGNSPRSSYHDTDYGLSVCSFDIFELSADRDETVRSKMTIVKGECPREWVFFFFLNFRKQIFIGVTVTHVTKPTVRMVDETIFRFTLTSRTESRQSRARKLYADKTPSRLSSGVPFAESDQGDASSQNCLLGRICAFTASLEG